MTSEQASFGCRIFDIRQTADQMLNIRHPKKHASDVEYSTFDGRLIKCRIFDGRLIEYRKSDIRRSAFRMSDFRHSTDGQSNRKNPTQQIRRIELNLRHSIRQNAHV